MHWFLDKLNLTGSIYQLINGVVLISTFFFCRLVWGSINSLYVFADIWKAIQHNNVPTDDTLGLKTGLGQTQHAVTSETANTAQDNIMAYAGPHSLPMWLALSYLASNIVLNTLNYYWFAKMIETLRKRFDPPLGTKRVEKKKEGGEEKEVPSEVEIQKGVFDDGRKTLELQGRDVRSRRRG